MKHLEIVLHVMHQHKFYAIAKKCSFWNSEIAYLRHIISAKGVASDPKKVEAMLSWPVPRSVTELRGFLGLIGYYRKFVRNYVQIARPLTNLLKKDEFEW